MYEDNERRAAINFDQLPSMRREMSDAKWRSLKTSVLEWDILAGGLAAIEYFYVDDNMQALPSFAFALQSRRLRDACPESNVTGWFASWSDIVVSPASKEKALYVLSSYGSQVSPDSKIKSISRFFFFANLDLFNQDYFFSPPILYLRYLRFHCVDSYF